jgi:hypothetical protein
MLLVIKTTPHLSGPGRADKPGLAGWLAGWYSPVGANGWCKESKIVQVAIEFGCAVIPLLLEMTITPIPSSAQSWDSCVVRFRSSLNFYQHLTTSNDEQQKSPSQIKRTHRP